MDVTKYPKRESHFAHRAVRKLIKECVALHHGADVFMLLVVISMTEDAKRYRGPVAFHNEVLLPLVGFSKWERLDRARKAAVDAGWLHYEAQGKRRPGLYWITIPVESEAIEDTPVDEDYTPVCIPHYTPEEDTERDIQGGTDRGIQGDIQRGILLPKPKPIPEEPPTPFQGDLPEKKIQDVPIPDGLQTEEFRVAWGEWITHRKTKKKPLSALSGEKLLKKFVRWGLAKTIAAIEHSIANGWQGVFPPDAKEAAEADDSHLPLRTSKASTKWEDEHWNPINPPRDPNFRYAK